MPYPKAVDVKVRAALDELAADATLIQHMKELGRQLDEPTDDRGVNEHRYRSSFRSQLAAVTSARPADAVATALGLVDVTCAKIREQLLTVLALLGDERGHLSHMAQRVRGLGTSVDDVRQMMGIIMALKSDYESGRLDSLAHHVEAEVAAEYLAQAARLLAESPVPLTHGTAAVLYGAVFENSMRALCARAHPPIATSLPNGKPKTLSNYIDDLKITGLYNELKAKELRWVAGVRNHAAHGQFGEFGRADVERMAAIVTQFLTDFM